MFDYIQTHDNPALGYIAKRTGYDSLSNFQPQDDQSEILEYITSGKKIRPAKPSEFHAWNGDEVTGSWVAASPDISEIKPRYEKAFDDHIHSVVQQQPFGYTDINSASKFQYFPDGYQPNQTELDRQQNSIALFAWILLVWREVDFMYAEVINGSPLPTIQDAVNRLPVFNP